MRLEMLIGMQIEILSGSRNYRFMALFKYSIEKRPRTIVWWLRSGFRFSFRWPFRVSSSTERAVFIWHLAMRNSDDRAVCRSHWNSVCKIAIELAFLAGGMPRERCVHVCVCTCVRVLLPVFPVLNWGVRRLWVQNEVSRKWSVTSLELRTLLFWRQPSSVARFRGGNTLLPCLFCRRLTILNTSTIYFSFCVLVFFPVLDWGASRLVVENWVVIFFFEKFSRDLVRERCPFSQEVCRSAKISREIPKKKNNSSLSRWNWLCRITIQLTCATSYAHQLLGRASNGQGRGGQHTDFLGRTANSVGAGYVIYINIHIVMCVCIYMYMYSLSLSGFPRPLWALGRRQVCHIYIYTYIVICMCIYTYTCSLTLSGFPRRSAHSGGAGYAISVYMYIYIYKFYIHIHIYIYIVSVSVDFRAALRTRAAPGMPYMYIYVYI